MANVTSYNISFRSCALATNAQTNISRSKYLCGNDMGMVSRLVLEFRGIGAVFGVRVNAHNRGNNA